MHKLDIRGGCFLTSFIQISRLQPIKISESIEIKLLKERIRNNVVKNLWVAA